jgi:hypothetical protein
VLLAALAGCALLRPLPPPPEPQALLAALQRRQAWLETLSLEARGRLSTPGGELRGDISLAAARSGLLRLEAYGLFGQPALFVVVRDDELRAVNFSEHRYYVGPTTSPRMAALLPLGLSAAELFSLLSAAPLPAEVSAWRSAPPGEAAALQQAARSRGRAALVAEGAPSARLLFGDELELLAASFGPPGCELVALYSDWRRLDGGSFPFSLQFLLPEAGRSLRLNVSEARLNLPLPPATFLLEPPPGFAIVRVP